MFGLDLPHMEVTLLSSLLLQPISSVFVQALLLSITAPADAVSTKKCQKAVQKRTKSGGDFF
jgi:hypothetical protein